MSYDLTLLLQGWRQEVTHPRTGERMNWEALLPEDFQCFLDNIDAME